mmetsp:Transcript_13555/g.31501  ORF Transcript_13555/g.31501 Transcript_13555/m.31501 type:complete len:168 (-) Transcript_13555:152-655(-)
MIASMTTGHQYLCIAVVGRKAFVFGGNDLDCAEMYDMDTDCWILLSRVSQKRNGSDAVAVGKLMLVMGGCDGESGDTVEVLDTVSFTWTCLPSRMTLKRTDYAGVLVGDQIVVMGMASILTRPCVWMWVYLSPSHANPYGLFSFFEDLFRLVLLDERKQHFMVCWRR